MTNTGSLYYRNSLSVWWMGIFLILYFASAKAQPPVEEKIPPPLEQKEFIKLMDEKDKKIKEYKETIDSLTAQLEQAGSSCKQTQQKCDSEKAGLNKKLVDCEKNIPICPEPTICQKCEKPKECPNPKPCPECQKPTVCPKTKPCPESEKPKVCPDLIPCPTCEKPKQCPDCPKQKSKPYKAKVTTEPSISNPKPVYAEEFREKKLKP